MKFTSNVDEKIALYSIHIHYFPEVLPRLFCRGIFSIAVALIFTVVLHIFARGGRKVGGQKLLLSSVKTTSNFTENT